jgi:hypothetical protein
VVLSNAPIMISDIAVQVAVRRFPQASNDMRSMTVPVALSLERCCGKTET